MTFNEMLAQKVRTALKHAQRVEEKKMFGGVAFLVNGKMCVTVGHNRLMCRIDPLLHDEAIQRKGATTVKMNGREYRGYIYVSQEGLESATDFKYWMRLSLDFNKRAKSSRGRTRK